MPATPQLVSYSPEQAGAQEAGGLTSGRAVGYTTLSGTSTQPLRATDYVEPGAEGQRSISSASGQDVAPSGAGARQVKIVYYDGNMDGPWEETVALNGANAVNTIATNIAFIERMEVAEVGSNGSNAAVITLYDSPDGGGSAVGTILTSDNRTFWSHHYVRTGLSAHITEARIGSNTVDGRAILSKRNPLDPTIPQVTIETYRFTTTSTTHRFSVPETIDGPAIVFLNVAPDSSTIVDIQGSIGFYEPSSPEEEFMSVQTVAAPTPPNNNLARSLFVWTANDGTANDILDTDQKMNDLLTHCNTYGINVLFLGTFPYLGKTNWTGARQQRMQLLVERCHQSGIQVFALGGNVDWGQNHKWVMENIILYLRRYQDQSTEQQRFDGCILDVEYWTDEVTYPPATHLPGLMDLVRKFQDHLDIPCGVFSAFYLLGNDNEVAARSDISYRGINAQDGEHMCDYADFVVIGAYDDIAGGQDNRFQSWYDYATASGTDRGRNVGLYMGSETSDDVSLSISWWDEGRASMESAHTTTSNTFYVVENSVFLGHAIHDYEHHSTMSA